LKYNELIKSGCGTIRGESNWGKHGVSIRKAGVNYSSIYLGEKFNTNMAVLMPNDSMNLLPIFLFINSTEFKKKVRELVLLRLILLK
jgi:hypothetical protein